MRKTITPKQQALYDFVNSGAVLIATRLNHDQPGWSHSPTVWKLDGVRISYMTPQSLLRLGLIKSDGTEIGETHNFTYYKVVKAKMK
ncbi:hypothetical protein [uncultured Mucilaginibacter sp.]|uniref:hypothetical protein n=1 Tax=uncultured Mucilaginibacter sp. TaxID=797541 RepID=UPI0025FCE418|nr:hypothetical protein [uncultured Mucilaginibacter sp.]